MKGDGKLIEH